MTSNGLKRLISTLVFAGMHQLALAQTDVKDYAILIDPIAKASFSPTARAVLKRAD